MCTHDTKTYSAKRDNMHIKRLAYQTLLDWKTFSDRKAMIVTGARQVGKTYLIREFAQKEYENFLEINFVETPSAGKIFEESLDPNEIIINLSALASKPFIPGKTLIFFDEIQECPKARTAIKFLVDDGRFDYIESGSLLGVQYKEVPSYPVGYEQHVRMYPLSLREFFAAMGIGEDAIEYAQDAFLKDQPIPLAIHQKLKKAFLLYMVVGGMPDAVSTFVQSNDLNKTYQVQDSILNLYRQDIAKYANNKPHVKLIFDCIVSELDKKNKRFKLSDLSKTARMDRYASDFMWLIDAGVGLPTYNVNAPVSPLSINTQRNLFKLFLCDTGLLSAQMSGQNRIDLLQGNVSINWGSALENAIAQELTSKSYSLNYFLKQKYGEVDFLIEKDGKVLPIEVKSGKSYKSHKALQNVLDVKEWKIKNSLVLCSDNVSKDGKITYAPWYCAMFLDQAEGPGFINLANYFDKEFR